MSRNKERRRPTSVQWEYLKEVVNGLREPVKKYNKPVYNHGRMAYVVESEDGNEHIFDDRDEAEEFYVTKQKEFEAVFGK